MDEVAGRDEAIGPLSRAVSVDRHALDRVRVHDDVVYVEAAHIVLLHDGEGRVRLVLRLLGDVHRAHVLKVRHHLLADLLEQLLRRGSLVAVLQIVTLILSCCGLEKV